MKQLQRLLVHLARIGIDPRDQAWFRTILRSHDRPPVFLNGMQLPGFPPEELQRNTTGGAGRETIEEAFAFYRDCLALFNRSGVPLDDESLLLDFGMGWGRIARLFLRELPLGRIHGIDVTEEFVRICREAFCSENFVVSDPLPPTAFDTGTFSHIVGYSVFSHLSEEACLRWMAEFHRILSPGGVVVLTTRSRDFLAHCESLRGAVEEFEGALGALFDDFDDARRRYDDGEFVHSNRHEVSGGGAMTSAFYGESFIPPAYAARAYSRWFDLVAFLDSGRGRSQPVLYFRRKEVG
ncbi:MAG TPA: class I SAM-dependent methyltransferase [Thermoanaerobaculia bacterium]